MGNLKVHMENLSQREEVYTNECYSILTLFEKSFINQ